MPRCKVLRFLPLLVLLFASCNRDPKVQAQRQLDIANRFFAKAKYREAAIMYKKAIQKDMRFGEGYYRLALTELKLGNYGDALRWLRRAVELQPNNTDAITKLADLYLLASTQNASQAVQLRAEVKDLADKLLQQNIASQVWRGKIAVSGKHPCGGAAQHRRKRFRLVAFEDVERQPRVFCPAPAFASDHNVCLHRTGQTPRRGRTVSHPDPD